MSAGPAAPAVEAVADIYNRIEQGVSSVVQGKPQVIRLALIALLAEGHLLVEDVPGVGKTMLAKSIARSIACSVRRVQFTPDLLPSDITGTTVYNAETHDWEFKPGAVFANIVLGDEINRAGPKTQSALLEAMSEQTVSVDGTSHALPEPFFVVATQNPLEHHGTHPLPESQLDRFLMRLSLGYPDREHEASVLSLDPSVHTLPNLTPVLDLETLVGLQQVAEAVKLEESVVGYLLDLVEATRKHDGLALGASTRGALALRRAAQASAIADGRDYCIPEDVRDHAVDVLAHRVAAHTRAGLPSAAEEPHWVLSEIVDRVAVPL